MLVYRTGLCLVLLLGVVPGCVLTDGTQAEIASADRLVRQHARDLATGRFTAAPASQPGGAPLESDSVPHLAMRPRRADAPDLTGNLRQAAWAQGQPLFGEAGQGKGRPQPFRIPSGLPGAGAAPLGMLRIFSWSPFPVILEQPAQFFQRIAPSLPPLPPAPTLAPGPEGRPLTLDDLQRLGMQHSPAIKKARAAVDAAVGAVKDASSYPNPTLGMENDTVTTGPAGYVGFWVQQLIKTGGKVKLKEASALMDLRNAEVALRRAETDLIYAIRTSYFQVLVARENARINQALAEFAENIYRVQVNLGVRNFAAAYEPLQLRPLVYQARFNLLQARNAELAYWRQLAAALGRPEMPPTELAGKVDMPIPDFDYNHVLGHVLTWHTDVLTSENSIRQGQYNLALEKVTPIPDIDCRVIVQRDYSTPPFNLISPSFQAGFQLPVWNQNQGRIYQMRANLAQAVANLDLTRNNLLSTLADAMNRYETSRMQVRVALQQVEDQVRVYRALRSRRQSEPAAVSFGDLFVAQQSLAGYIGGYITALGAQWQAVTDVANLIQSNNLYDPGQPPQPPGAPALPAGGAGAPCGPQTATPGPGSPAPLPRPSDDTPMPRVLPPAESVEERQR